MSLFEAKIRQVGTSLGVLLPKNVVEGDNLKNGETVQMAVLKKDHKLIEELFGSAKGAKPFRRDRNDRVF